MKSLILIFFLIFTNVYATDSDGDGVSDTIEQNFNTDPNDAASHIVSNGDGDVSGSIAILTSDTSNQAGSIS